MSTKQGHKEKDVCIYLGFLTTNRAFVGGHGRMLQILIKTFS